MRRKPESTQAKIKEDIQMYNNYKELKEMLINKI